MTFESVMQFLAEITPTQFGLTMDIVGFLLLAPSLNFGRMKALMFAPEPWTWRWCTQTLAILLIIGGFGTQLYGTF